SWHLAAIAAPAGWERYPGVYYTSVTKPLIPAIQRVLVGVLDTAVGRNNPDFRNSGPSDDIATGGQLDIAGMHAFGGLPPEFGPAAYHGTYVAGLVGATANNSFASAGVAYHADVLPLSVVHGGDGAADAATLGDGIVFAHQRGARVITLALGLTNPDPLVSAAIRIVTTAANPPLVVAAAGNANNDLPFYPAWFEGVMAVGGSDQLDLKASCANFGERISVVAPAKQVPSLGLETTMTVPNCGTSAATPQVAALAALLFAQSPGRTAAQVRSIIEDTADDIGPPGDDHFFGNGRINVDRALALQAATAATSGLRATPVRPGGGISRIEGFASGPSTLAEADLFVDRTPAGPGDAGFPLSAADGAFDSTAEALTGAYPSTLALGAHRIYARTRLAGGAWGPLASAVLYVDPIAPKVESLRAADTVRVLDGGTTISFDATDDYSVVVNYDVDVSLLGQDGLRAWRRERIVAPAGRQQITWTPRAFEPPGRYRVRVTLRDEAGNSSYAAADFLIL
ncbi:MAG: S8 family serine peptidase, partial [Actinomycetota bacterium]